MRFNYRQPYIVVCACIAREGKILLVKENHYPDAGKWNFPGGKLDFGEDPINGVRREAREETGLEYAPTSLLGIHSIYRTDIEGGIHALRIAFIGKASGTIRSTHQHREHDTAEIAECRWFEPEEILTMNDTELRYQDIKRIVRNYQNQQTYPLNIIAHLRTI